MTKPLLVIDGDSFAHRAYHAVPKTIRRAGNKGAGAIVGFANFLLRLYESERPRAVQVGWDTLDAPTYRHKALEGYQAGRRFDDDLIDQLAVLPEFVAACGFASAKAAGYEADDFLAAAAAQEEREGGPRLLQRATATPISSRPRRRPSSSQCARAKWCALVLLRCASAMGWIPGKCPISSPCEATRLTGYRARKGSGRRERRAFSGDMDRLRMRLRQDAFLPKPRSCASIVRLRPWIDRRRCRRCRIKNPLGAGLPP